MKTIGMLGMIAISFLLATRYTIHAETIKFAGYTWVVRPTGRGGPGPNYWDQDNAFVDDKGFLHLKLTHRNDKWYSSEVYMQDRLGFGKYEFWLTGPVARLDQNVVLGLFNYPTHDVGPDATHEIDIEFAQWGSPSAPLGNYTVWPTTNTVRRDTHAFAFPHDSDSSMHSFTWTPTNLIFQSAQGEKNDKTASFASWRYQPPNPGEHIAQKPMPVHLNLWCFRGLAPTNGEPVEVIVRAFKFAPLGLGNNDPHAR